MRLRRCTWTQRWGKQPGWLNSQPGGCRWSGGYRAGRLDRGGRNHHGVALPPATPIAGRHTAPAIGDNTCARIGQLPNGNNDATDVSSVRQLQNAAEQGRSRPGEALQRTADGHARKYSNGQLTDLPRGQSPDRESRRSAAPERPAARIRARTMRKSERRTAKNGVTGHQTHGAKTRRADRAPAGKKRSDTKRRGRSRTCRDVGGYEAGGMRLAPEGAPTLDTGLSMATGVAGTNSEVEASATAGRQAVRAREPRRRPAALAVWAALLVVVMMMGAGRAAA